MPTPPRTVHGCEAQHPKRSRRVRNPKPSKEWLAQKPKPRDSAETHNRGNPNPKESRVVQKTKPKTSGAKTKVLKAVAVCEKPRLCNEPVGANPQNPKRRRNGAGAEAPNPKTEYVLSLKRSSWSKNLDPQKDWTDAKPKTLHQRSRCAETQNRKRSDWCKNPNP